MKSQGRQDVWTHRAIFLMMAVSLFTTACIREKKVSIKDQEVALNWADMSLEITKNTPANSPTYSSRCFGYIGLTMYESIVHGYPGYNSLAGQLNGLAELPLPDEALKYNWVLSMNAAQATILKRIYNQTSDANKQRIDSLETALYKILRQEQEAALVQRSVDFGRAVAEAIFEWSKTDGGHRGYLNNFDKSLSFPEGEGAWEPTLYGQSFSHFPLHPHWGRNRTFATANSELPLPEMKKYDTTGSSDYYSEFRRVYDKSMTLTQEEKEIALWWGDDPGDTYSPPGHSYYLATVVLRAINPELPTCAETFARVGMASADAFICCWKWKYHFWSERPSSFIPRHIDEAWVSFWPDPPFPAFPSGHATQAAATAMVFTDLYGEHLAFTDSAHAGRPRDDQRDVDFKPRAFNSFWQVAQETADSRFYGGIHTHQDNDVGLREGVLIAANINALPWRKNEEYASKKSE